jgi:HK97 family phage prohead protease
MTEMIERPKAPVVDDLTREVSFELRDAGAESDGLTLDGYGAVFDSPTRIDSWEGVFDEEIARGAFKKSLAERTPVLQFDHGRHPMVGSIPLGSFESLREDQQGLHVVARLHDNWLVQPVRDAIKSKAIPGMSFRFSVVKDEWRDAAGKPIPMDEVGKRLWASDPSMPETIMKRTLKEVRLFEVGPVVFPAYTDTSVGVRALMEHHRAGHDALAAYLSNPQVRAELAAALVGTPSEPSDAEGASGEGRAATTADEPPAGTPGKPVLSPATRTRDLIEIGVLSHG